MIVLTVGFVTDSFLYFITIRKINNDHSKIENMFFFYCYYPFCLKAIGVNFCFINKTHLRFYLLSLVVIPQNDGIHLFYFSYLNVLMKTKNNINLKLLNSTLVCHNTQTNLEKGKLNQCKQKVSIRLSLF